MIFNKEETELKDFLDTARMNVTSRDEKDPQFEIEPILEKTTPRGEQPSHRSRYHESHLPSHRSHCSARNSHRSSRHSYRAQPEEFKDCLPNRWGLEEAAGKPSQFEAELESDSDAD